MNVLVEAFGGAASDALRGAVGRDQLRVQRFKLYEASQEGVVFNVGNLRALVKVVQLFVAAKLFAQMAYLSFDCPAFLRQVPFSSTS
jgi:hypothetical protein